MKVALASFLLASAFTLTAFPSQAQSVPTFRVPLDPQGAYPGSDPVFAWVETTSNCSKECGSGARETNHICHDLTKVDVIAGGFGAPEARSSCESSVGAAPADSSTVCTNYAGCTYDWVKPAEVVTVLPIGENPIGRVGCGNVKREFIPHCKRSDGTILASGDHAFCKNDLPDYQDVRMSKAGALGYSKTALELNQCTTSDNDWKLSEWSSWSSLCSSNAIRTRQVQCIRKFDGAIKSDSSCSGAKPSSSETESQYGSCSYSAILTSSQCTPEGLERQAFACQRSDGVQVQASFCGLATLTKLANTAGCSGGSWTSGDWSEWGSCTDNMQLRTRPVECRSLNKSLLLDTQCKEQKPASSETQNCGLGRYYIVGACDAPNSNHKGGTGHGIPIMNKCGPAALVKHGYPLEIDLNTVYEVYCTPGQKGYTVGPGEWFTKARYDLMICFPEIPPAKETFKGRPILEPTNIYTRMKRNLMYGNDIFDGIPEAEIPDFLRP